MWINLLVAAVLLVGMIVGLYLLPRYLKGERIGFPLLARAAAQKVDSGDDLDRFMAAYRRDKAQGGAPAARPEGIHAPAPRAAARSPTLAVATVKPKASFLAGPNKLLYLVLRTALPDHQIFPNVRLADALQIAGQPPTPQARAQLAQARVDFVVCNKELAVVALVDISDGNRADDVLKRQIEPQITAAGGRYLRVAPTAIPRPAEARSLVCGA
ncbi:MAG TPA: DUF2726 domain-containing protein [Burkholderiales bacterium]|jgi:hypothetical protein